MQVGGLWVVLGLLAGLVLGGLFLSLIRKRKASRVIKFGHAFPHPKEPAADPVGEATGVLNGTAPLGPRDPHEKSAVWEAERLLGIARLKRPVYSYVGCLHPELGRIGLIVAPEWFRREPHGVSRCDTGGLAGRIGGFRYLDEVEARNAVTDLSHRPCRPWRSDLLTEVAAAFVDFRGYLRGQPPNPDCYTDVRQKCIDAVRHASERLDRRLWTWEARCFASITADDVDAVALAPEAWKEFSARFDGDLPAHVQFLIGHAAGTGIHHFNEEQVVTAFERRRA